MSHLIYTDITINIRDVLFETARKSEIRVAVRTFVDIRPRSKHRRPRETKDIYLEILAPPMWGTILEEDNYDASEDFYNHSRAMNALDK